MDTTQKAIGAIAVVVIVIAFVGIVRGCSCSRATSPDEFSDETRAWIHLVTFGHYICPHCRKTVALTDEQLKLTDPPELVCAHCRKNVDLADAKPTKPPYGTEPPTYEP